jgi:hypothetical protein
MAKLPDYFEYFKEHHPGERTNLSPMYYDQSVRYFFIGETKVALEDYDPYTYRRRSRICEEEGEHAGLFVDEIADHPLMIPAMGTVIAGPKLHEFVQADPSHVERARGVMVDAFKQFCDELPVEIESSGGHLGFSSSLDRDGAIHLQVLGDCACLGATPDEGVIHGKIEHGFATYALHNADTQAQRASLYAGLGHLARLVDDKDVAQASLF